MPNTPVSKLPPDMAEKLLRADVANIIKKLREGKTLTRAERAILQSAADPATTEITDQDTAKNLTDLASILGVSRQVIYKWKKLTGAPAPQSNGLHDVIAWRAFMQGRGLSSSKASDEESAAPDGLDEGLLKRKKLALEIASREIDLAVKRSEYVAIDAVRSKWGSAIGRATALLRTKLENELPPILSGLDAIGIQKELARVVDEFAKILHEGGDDD